MNIPRALKTARECAGLSQAEVAKMIGVAAGTVAGWELGTHTPRWKSLRRFAEVTGRTVADLIG